MRSVPRATSPRLTSRQSRLQQRSFMDDDDDDEDEDEDEDEDDEVDEDVINGTASKAYGNVAESSTQRALKIDQTGMKIMETSSWIH